ncbi:MAG: phosphatase PAP2 family protein [Planctomycetota bacterium]
MVPPPGLAVEETAREKSRSLIWTAVAGLRPADQVQLGYNIIVGLLLLVALRHGGGAAWCLVQNVLLVLLIPWIASGSTSARIWRRELADWYHIPAILLSFKQLAAAVPLVNPHDRDAALAALDKVLFGVDPVVWLERFHHPLLTEILQISYCVFYVLPVVLFVRLKYRNTARRDFEYGLFAVTACFCLTFLGYLSVPALGPRYLLQGDGVPLEGVLLFSMIRQGLDSMEGVMRDCFPSGHTAVTMLMLHFAWRHDRVTYRVFLLPSIGLIVSTVYLRYHYLVDVVAGVACYSAVMLVAPRIFAILERRLLARGRL